MNEKLTSEMEAPEQPEAGKGPEPEKASTPVSPEPAAKASTRGGLKSDLLITCGAWVVAISMVLLAVYFGIRTRAQAAAPSSSSSSNSASQMLATATRAPQPELSATPALVQQSVLNAIIRRVNLMTLIPTRPREDVITYTVGTGDSVFGIAKNFNIKPESVLWANYDQLKDSPDMLTPGMALKIPPVNGVYYEWKEGDTVDAVAAKYSAKAEDIIDFAGNHLDLTNPKIAVGQGVMVPGGKRELVQWVLPTIPRGAAGVSANVYGPGACAGGYTGGAYGSGTFIWPSVQHVLSGNDYWSGHLGIDIAGGLGDAVVASDAGVIVFSGWSTQGYGNMILIDHGNGYQTLYSHLSVASAKCGASVGQGSYIGAVGSTGNSTGPHLHFEIRYGGGFVNPWNYLPAP